MSPVGQPVSYGPSGALGQAPLVNAFWSEKTQGETLLRAMRPAGLPEEPGGGIPQLHEFIAPEKAIHSPGSDPGFGLGSHMAMKMMANENQQLRQELLSMKEAMLGRGAPQPIGSSRPLDSLMDLHHGGVGGVLASRGGLNEMLGTAMGGMKELLGIGDPGASTLIPNLGGGSLTMPMERSWSGNPYGVGGLHHGGAPLPVGTSGMLMDKFNAAGSTSDTLLKDKISHAALVGVGSQVGIGSEGGPVLQGGSQSQGVPDALPVQALAVAQGRASGGAGSSNSPRSSGSRW